MKIAHFVDDEKFVDSAFRQFETIMPSSNVFFVAARKYCLKYIKETPVKFINRFSYANFIFMKKLKEYDLVVLHSLNEFNSELVNRSDESIKFVWIGLGFDYYNLIYDDSSFLYFPKTYNIFKDYEKNHFYSLSKRTFSEKVKRKLLCRYPSKRNVVERINFFAPVISDEYELIKSKNWTKFPEYIDWNYNMDSALFRISNNNNLNGNNILLGNSATFTNNHVESIDLLKGIVGENVRIVCPLSYGNQHYGNYIEEYGKAEFGKSFIAVRTFLSFERYLSILKGCSNVIMNHKRQQGLGNIMVMLYMGAKVFLNRTNPVYNFLTSNGIKVYLISDLIADPSLIYKPLNRLDQEINCQIVRKLTSYETALEKTRNLIEKVL